jgi:hypothetical protein
VIIIKTKAAFSAHNSPQTTPNWNILGRKVCVWEKSIIFARYV